MFGIEFEKKPTRRLNFMKFWIFLTIDDIAWTLQDFLDWAKIL